jgi:hypothetical protein
MQTEYTALPEKAPMPRGCFSEAMTVALMGPGHLRESRRGGHIPEAARWLGEQPMELWTASATGEPLPRGADFSCRARGGRDVDVTDPRRRLQHAQLVQRKAPRRHAADDLNDVEAWCPILPHEDLSRRLKKGFFA